MPADSREDVRQADPPESPAASSGGHAREEAFVVAADEEGRRLDMFLKGRLPDRSRTEIQRLIRAGHVILPHGTWRSGTPVTAGLRVRIAIPHPVTARLEAENLPLTVLYDDADVVVIDKPAGMVVHPGAGHRAGTLVNALLHHVVGLSGLGGEERPGIVHRLDRGTSGVMVVAKHDQAHRGLAAQFHDRTVGKEYVALVWGRPAAGQLFDRPIGRDPRQRQRMSTRARRAREASTRIVSVEPLGVVSLVRVRIGTGRTHQIRVHLADAGHPVVGDAVYGGRRQTPGLPATVSRLTRPFLHASSMTFTQPNTGERLTIDAPLAPDLVEALGTLRERA